MVSVLNDACQRNKETGANTQKQKTISPRGIEEAKCFKKK